MRENMAVSFTSGTNWCHDFPKIARESGFNFSMHRSRVRVDWKRISSIDIDRVIVDRDFSTIDQNVDNIVDCCLENEYDVKILEPNFVKLFRLAQLAVEYLLYCKRYLDRSVVILKEELKSKLEENVKLKKEIDTFKSKEKRNRDSERRINDSNGEIHKCPRCPKTFVSATFMNAHFHRRHSHLDVVTSLEESPTHKRYLDEAEKLHNEIKTLKERLNRTERVIRNESERYVDSDGVNFEPGNGGDEGRETPNKDDEHYKRYQREIRYLKGTLLSEIRNLKRAETIRGTKEDGGDSSDENVKELIRRQEKEIERLRDELQKRLTPDIEGIHAKLENQEDFWQSKINNLEIRYRNDIEKLYSQLKVSHESVNELRLDYTSKINDLEWRSRNESIIIKPQRKIVNTQDDGENESREDPQKDNNYTILEKRERHEENSRDESTRKGEILSEVAADMLRKDTMPKLMPTDKDRQDNWNGYAVVPFGPTINRNRCDGIDRGRNKPKIERQQRDTSSVDSSERISATTTNEKRAARKNAIQVLDSSDGTASEVEKVQERFVGPTRQEEIPVKENNDKNVEASSILSSEESVNSSEDEVESQTEETDEFSNVVKLNERNDRVMEESIEDRLNSKLRDLGIDPEWRAIPNATFAQIINTIGHDRNLMCKKYHNFDEIRYKIIQEIGRKLLGEENLGKIEYSSKRSTLEKLVTNVKSKASKAIKILEKNNGSRRNIDSSKVDKTETLHRQTDQRISEQITHHPDMYGSPTSVVIRKPTVATNYHNLSTASDLKHSYESIEDFIRDRKIVTSTPQRDDKKSTLDSVLSVNNVTTNNKSVLKSTSATNGNRTIKKKVLFDLESETSPEREHPKSDARNSSIYDSRDTIDIRKIEESPQSGSIVLKTRQSERIAQISKQIEKQLSIPREKPAGAVEAMFMDKFYSKSDDEESMVNGRIDSDNDLSKGDSPHRPASSESKDSNLDMDIEELLEIQ